MTQFRFLLALIPVTSVKTMLPVAMLLGRLLLTAMVTAPGPVRDRARAVSMRLILEALTLNVSVLNVLRAEARELLYMTATLGRAMLSRGLTARMTFRLVLLRSRTWMLNLVVPWCSALIRRWSIGLVTGSWTLTAGAPRLLAVRARLGCWMLWFVRWSLLKVRGSAILRIRRRLTQSRLGLLGVAWMMRLVYIPLSRAWFTGGSSIASGGEGGC